MNTLKRPPYARTVEWQIAKPSPSLDTFECAAVWVRTNGSQSALHLIGVQLN